jgi:hypothetical protein
MRKAWNCWLTPTYILLLEGGLASGPMADGQSMEAAKARACGVEVSRGTGGSSGDPRQPDGSNPGFTPRLFGLQVENAKTAR